MCKKILLVIGFSLSTLCILASKKSDSYYSARFANMTDKSSGISLYEQFQQEEQARQPVNVAESKKTTKISAESKTAKDSEFMPALSHVIDALDVAMALLKTDPYCDEMRSDYKKSTESKDFRK